LRSPQFGVLVGFHLLLIVMLALDLGVFHRRAHAVSVTEAAIWSGVWVFLALTFAWGIWFYWDRWHPERPPEGSEKAVEFLTGYVIEKSLSVDNLFIFLVIFRYFAVPPALQHRVLVWGILGAVVLRATLILLGVALLAISHWTTYFFGLLLLVAAYKLLRTRTTEYDPSRNLVLRLARRFLPLQADYDSTHFWVRREGRWFATPLPLVLLVVESTDVFFAIDSIPAVFAITQDPFIVYTSNIFAIMGLRSLYFLLAGVLDRFRYLDTGLALVLAFVGLKMLSEDTVRPYLEQCGIEKKELVLISLGVIAVILATTMIVSLLAGKKSAH
jgi:tellurite resistance protein TerC